MLIATNADNQLIMAEKELTKTTPYYCPSCRRPVHLKKGTVMRPHFAHFQKEGCAAFSEGETEEHIAGKFQLKTWLEAQGFAVELEAYLPKLQQRPDLLVTVDGREIALEFQCSPIPIYKVVQRTKGYLQAGYEVIWILGENFRYSRKLTAFQKACLTNIDGQLVLFHYSTTTKRLVYRYHFRLKQNQKMRHAKKILRTGQLHLRQKTKIAKAPVNTELEHNKLLRQLQYPTTKGKRFLETLYEMEESLVSMPKEMYTIMPAEWILQNHPYEWKLRFILWLETFPMKSIVTKKKLCQWTENLTYYHIPQMTDQQKLQPLLEYIEVLTESGVLQQIRFDKWVVVGYPKRYKFLEDKFR